jgi:glycosyltransferase involved in cell wall biosynthesis
MKVVPVGIDIGYWDGLQKEPTIAYAWRDAVRGKRTIFVAAQLIRRKGIDYLIRAMPEILTVQPKSVLLIAGDGSEEIVLRRLAHLLRLDGSVYFLGRVADGELSALYGTADVVVLSSLSEGLPTCLLEALVHKKPVVATRIDGAKDYFSDVVELVEPADSAALAGGVLDVLGNMRAAADKAAAGRRLVEKAFHWPVLAEQMVSAYRTAIAAAGERLQ